jgi:hypothetical protein
MIKVAMHIINKSKLPAEDINCQKLLFFKTILFLIYLALKIQGDFTIIISYMHTVYLEQVYLCIIFPFPLFVLPLLSNNVWWISLYCLPMYIRSVLSSSSLLVSFSFPSPVTFPHDPVSHKYSCPVIFVIFIVTIIIITLGLDSTNK